MGTSQTKRTGLASTILVCPTSVCPALVGPALVGPTLVGGAFTNAVVVLELSSAAPIRVRTVVRHRDWWDLTEPVGQRCVNIKNTG